MNKIRISAVSYLNTKPFLYGLEHAELFNDIELYLDTPAVCADKLLSGKVDIGLVPVAVLPQMREYQILTEYCIGAVDTVQSVMLYSGVELNSIEKIYLDYQSRTSVMLTKVLAQFHWRIAPQWENAENGYEAKISGNTAGVIIGDRALGLNGKFPYSYDLAQEWKHFTSRPFVFACWVANKQLPNDFIRKFEVAISNGIANKEAAIQEWINKTDQKINVRQYLEKCISYEFDDAKKQGMALFMDYLSRLN